MTAHEREHRGDGEGDAQRERQPPEPDVSDGRHREPCGAPARARAVDAKHQSLEQRGRGEHRQHRQHTQAEQRGQRREQQAIAGQCVTGVPVLVPDGEPRAFEQTNAVDLRGEVGGARVDEQPRQHQRKRQRHERAPAARDRVVKRTGVRGATAPDPGPPATEVTVYSLEPLGRSEVAFDRRRSIIGTWRS